jgi:hypothetical protein
MYGIQANIWGILMVNVTIKMAIPRPRKKVQPKRPAHRFHRHPVICETFKLRALSPHSPAVLLETPSIEVGEARMIQPIFGGVNLPSVKIAQICSI